jgi:hypothetical protein
MPSPDHLAHLLHVARGRWGVFRALGGYLPAQLTADNLPDLVQIVEPRGERAALTVGLMPRTEAQCQAMCTAICDRLNQ